MEISPILQQQLPFEPSFSLKPGDQMAARVLKRVAPFRFLVSFAGKNFKVNSSVLLHPKQQILIQVTDIKPRLKFKLISAFSTSTPASLPATLGYPNSPLGAAFLEWSLRLNLPIKQSDFERLKKTAAKSQDQRKNPELLLLPFFWSRVNLDTSQFSDPDFLFRWMFESRGKEETEQQIQDEIQNGEISAEQTATVHRLMQLLAETAWLPNLFTVTHPLRALRDLLQTSPGEVAVNTLPPAGSSGGSLLNNLTQLVNQLVGAWNEGRWIFLPIGSGNPGNRIWSFLRKRIQFNPAHFEFIFSWCAKKLEVIAVEGKLDGNQLQLTFHNGHQEFGQFVDKNIIELKRGLGVNGLILKSWEFVQKEFILAHIGKILFEEKDPNIEVTI